MARFQYLILMGLCVLVTLPLEFVFDARVWRRPRRLAIALVPAFVAFVAWDLWATATGTWDFDPDYTVGVTLPSGEESVAHASGDGPIDAIFGAIRDAVGTEAELRRYWDGLSAGGTVSVPLERAPWGDTFGMCVGQFGVPWMVNIAGSSS